MVREGNNWAQAEPGNLVLFETQGGGGRERWRPLGAREIDGIPATFVQAHDLRDTGYAVEMPRQEGEAFLRVQSVAVEADGGPEAFHGLGILSEKRDNRVFHASVLLAAGYIPVANRNCCKETIHSGNVRCGVVVCRYRLPNR